MQTESRIKFSPKRQRVNIRCFSRLVTDCAVELRLRARVSDRLHQLLAALTLADDMHRHRAQLAQLAVRAAMAGILTMLLIAPR